MLIQCLKQLHAGTSSRVHYINLYEKIPSALPDLEDNNGNYGLVFFLKKDIGDNFPSASHLDFDSDAVILMSVLEEYIWKF